jgi:hypothetical protein
MAAETFKERAERLKKQREIREAERNTKRKKKAGERLAQKGASQNAKKKGALGSEGYKPTNTRIGSNMGKTTSPATKAKVKAKDNKAPIVTKKQLKDSGFTSLRDYLNNQRGLTRRSDKPKTNNSNATAGQHSTSSRHTPLTAKSKVKAEKSEAKKPEAKKFDRMKAARNQMKSARASMGFKKGGRVDGCATRGLTRAKRSR